MQLQLPNIYARNYDWYVAIPIALVVLSLYAVLVSPGLRYGIDLRGGALITLHGPAAIDANVIGDVLRARGFTDFNIRAYTTAVGYAAEVEIPTDERIKAVDGLLSKISALSSKYDEHVAEIIRLRTASEVSPSPEISAKLAEIEQAANTTADELLSLAQNALSSINEIAKVNVSLSGDAAKAKDEVRAAFEAAKEEHYRKLLQSLLSAARASSYSLEEVSPTLSAYFIDRIVEIAVVAAVLAVVLVFLIFRVPIPCLIILTGSGIDIALALGAMAAFGIPLGLPAFATLITLAGLSLDTDTMLSIRALKHKVGTPKDRVHGAMRTGIAMTTTTIGAFVVLLALGLAMNISVYTQIGLVGLAGLIGDIIATWLFNAPLVLWYLEGKLAKLAIPIRHK